MERAGQGHHRHHGFSQCVQRYSRDDVTPQLNCQRALLKVLDSGWRPGVPLQRGVGCLVHERAGQESDTESDSSGSSSSSAALSDLDNQSVGGSENSLSDAADLEGPWLLNTLSGVADKRIKQFMWMAMKILCSWLVARVLHCTRLLESDWKSFGLKVFVHADIVC